MADHLPGPLRYQLPSGPPAPAATPSPVPNAPESSSPAIFRLVAFWRISCADLTHVNLRTAMCNPFCVVILGEQELPTNVFKHNRNPRWPTPITGPVPEGCTEAVFHIQDWSAIHSPVTLGTYIFVIPEGFGEGEVTDAPLRSPEGCARQHGTLSFHWQLLPTADFTFSSRLVDSVRTQGDKVAERKARLAEGPLNILPSGVVRRLAREHHSPMATQMQVPDGVKAKGQVTIEAIIASGLPAVSLRHPQKRTAEPYCSVRLHSSIGTEEVFTEVGHQTLNPQWLDPIVLRVWEPDCRVEFTVWHWAHLQDVELGTVVFPLDGGSRTVEKKTRLSRCPGQQIPSPGSLYVKFIYDAPSQTLDECIAERVTVDRKPNFGQIIIRDLEVTGLQHSMALCPFLEFNLSSSIGCQLQQTRILPHTNRPVWNHFVTFDIFDRGMDLSVHLLGANLTVPLPDTVLGLARFAIPGQTTHGIVEGKLFAERQTKATEVGALRFSMSVIYIDTLEFWSSLDADQDLYLQDVFANDRRRPKMNPHILKRSGMVLYHYVVWPLDAVRERVHYVVSWRNPIISLLVLFASLYICYREWFFQTLACLFLTIFPSTYVRQQGLASEAEEVRKQAALQAEALEQRQQVRADHLAHRKQRAQQSREAKKQMLRNAWTKAMGSSHVQGVPLVELWVQLQRDMKRHWEIHDVADYEEEEQEEDRGDVFGTRAVGYLTWDVYSLHGFFEDYVCYFTWQDPRQTGEVLWYSSLFAASTFVVPFAWYAAAGVIYMFTVHGMYVRYPVLWQRFPPWRLPSMLPTWATLRHFCAEVDVTIVGATDLVPHRAGMREPYVLVRQPRSGRRHSTSVKHGTLNPVWNEQIPLMYVRRRGSRVIFEIWDYKFLSFIHAQHQKTNFSGYAECNIWGPSKDLRIALPLKPRPGFKEYCTGYLHILLSVRMLSREEESKLQPDNCVVRPLPEPSTSAQPSHSTSPHPPSQTPSVFF